MKKNLAVLCLFLLGITNAQQSDYVDFTTANAYIYLMPDSSKVSGSIEYSFKVLKTVDSVYIDAKAMRFNSVEVSAGPATYKNDSNKLWIVSRFVKDSSYTVSFNYEAYPKKALYFLKRNSEWNIWTQGQGKYTSNWLPSFDDVNEKVEFDLSIIFDKNYKVLSNGILKAKDGIDGNYIWHYDMQHPMSSYLVAIAIGKYNKKTELSKTEIPLEYYYYPEDSLFVEPTYRYSKEMFDFLEEEIGYSYPWQIYRQVPVHDFLYAGMENTGLTIFSDAFIVDSIGFNDKNYVNVNAHELAHQWFGDLVTAKSGEHHWLQEGFATYYALLAERHVFGDDYFYFKLFETAQDLGRQDINGNGTSLLNPKSSSLTFYQRGAWVLYALREKVGDKIFRQAVDNYLRNHEYANVVTLDFMTEVEELLGQPLNDFVKNWIIDIEFPFDDAINMLKSQSSYIQEYLMIDCEAKSEKCKDYLRYYLSDDAKVKVIAQAPHSITKDVFNHGVKVRQAISQYVSKIPIELKPDYETLLNDKSYITVENALYNLWVNFPEERANYLFKTRNTLGFSDLNVRLLWLVLHLNTPEFQSDKKPEILEELIGYTSNERSADIRLNAFKYLDLINACNSKCKSNLDNATKHHNWRLVKYAKQLSDKLKINKK